MLFTEKDIEEQFSTDIIKRAKALIRHSQINFSRTERDGGLLIAIVEEADKPPFRIYVRTQKKHHKLSIQGECNCQYRTNCEHVVAALLQSLLNQKAQKNMLATDESKKPCSMEKSGQWRPRLASHQSLCFRLKIKNAEVGVEPCVAKRLVDGNYSTGRYFAPVKMRGRVPPSFITPLDMEILELLSDLPGRFEKNIPCLKGDKASHVLEMLLNSGRCFLEELEKNRQMSLGTNQKLEYHWQIDEHGYQCLNGHFFSKETQILLLDTPWYVAHRTGKCGRLLSDLQIPFIEELIRLSPVAPDQIEKISQHLEKHWPEAKYPALKQISIRTLPLTTRPVPCLGLISVNEKEKQGKDFLRLSFLYGDKNVALYDKGTFFEGEELVQLVRDEAVEREAVQQLLAAGFHEIEDKTGFYFVPENNHAEAWQNFQIDILPGLRDLGWHVEYDNFRYRIYKAKQWVCEAFRHHTADWFSLKLALDVEGNKIDLLPLLLALLKQFSCKLPSRDEIVTEYFMVPFDNKAGKECRLQLPVSRVLPLLDILIEVHQNASASEIRCNQGQLAKFATLESEDERTLFHWETGSDEIESLIQQLQEAKGISEVEPPSGLQASLRQYQQQGLDWLQFLREHQLAGILADDMGLGKTLQALAHILLEKESGRGNLPSLVIAPTSLMFNWRREVARFTPQLKLLVLHGPYRKAYFKTLASYDLIITTYPLLVRDSEILLAQPFHLLILDEAQVIKNPQSQSARTAKMMKAHHRICLTGTPMENHLGELWSLFDFLLPGILGSERQFRQQFRVPIEKHGDEISRRRLRRMIRPFLLRRTKQQVATELPPKTEIVQAVVMEEKQRELYEAVRLTMNQRVRDEIARQGLARSHIAVLDALLKLRQVCCDPRLLALNKAQQVQTSAKLDLLMTLLPEMVEEGRRILVFSQFTTMLGYIEQALVSRGIEHVKLTGETVDRQGPVQRFQTGEVPVFLISLKAGGVGLNLTAADTVIHYDPWWNPAVERQATDRAHRIGQQQTVFVYKLICEGTVEEKIVAMQQSKQMLADGLSQPDKQQWPLDDEDLQALFAPME